MASKATAWEGKSAGGAPIEIKDYFVNSTHQGYTPVNFDGNFVTPEILEQAAQAIRDHQAEQERKARVLVRYVDNAGDACQVELGADGSVSLVCLEKGQDYASAPHGHEAREEWLTDICKAYHQRMLEREAKA